MAWTAPLTWVSQAVTAALLNQQIRDIATPAKLEQTERALRGIVANELHTLTERDTALRGHDDILPDLQTVGVGFRGEVSRIAR